MNTNEEKKEYCINKELYNLEDLRIIFEEDFNEVITPKKYREKIAEIFEVLRINTDYLKDGEKGRNFTIPYSSVEFMHKLYDFYITSEGQELRKGNIEKAGLDNLLWIIDGFEEMFNALDLPASVIHEQIQCLKQRFDVEELQVKAEIKKLLNDLMLDFFPPKEENESEELRKIIFDKDRHFSYKNGLLSWEELSFFYQMVKKDLEELRYKHHKIFGYMGDIRSTELMESIEKTIENMTEEDFYGQDQSFIEQFDLDNWLLESEKYMELFHEKLKVEKLNDFIVDKERKIKHIQNEMDKIEKEIIREHLGEGAYCIHDYFDNYEDCGWEKTAEQVFNEAVEEYRKNDSVDELIYRIEV